MIGLEGAASRPAIAKVQQIGPDLFFREQVGRPLVMGGQAANAVNVDLLRPSRQSRQPHVFDHALAERRHRALGRVGHREAFPEVNGRTIPADPLL